MKPKQIYLFLCVVGLALPYCQFVPWVVIHGLNLRLFMNELFANRISAFFGMDVFVSAVVLIFFMRIENSRSLIKHWWVAVMATALVGVSLGLPLFLYLRERSLDQRAAHAAA